MAVVSALVVDRLGIRLEESHLAARFGQQWTDYASRVPRWLI
jgi:protein-S-isoprenylcysteine O-methyltransferase Ste14